MAWKYDKGEIPAPVADLVVTNPVTGNEQPVPGCLVDTGSDACWLRPSDIGSLGVTDNTTGLASVSGGLPTLYRRHFLTLRVWGRTFTDIGVMELAPESAIGPIVGRDIINKLELKLSGPDRGYEVADMPD